MNKENLLRMADYIETIPQEKFDMGLYRSDTSCGTIGCILGHCIDLDTNTLPRSYTAPDFVEWGKEFTGMSPSSGEWAYLFSSFWEHTDNTPKGAAKRIRHFVKRGRLPVDYDFQIDGQTRLSYL